MTRRNQRPHDQKATWDEPPMDEERMPRPHRRHTYRIIKVRVIAFIIGLVCGVLVMVLKPWTYVMGTKSNKNVTMVASEGGATLAIDTADENEKAVVTISYLQELTQDASDLVTTRYFYKDADTYSNTRQICNKNVPLTTTEYVYTYEGTISLGIDMSQIGFSVDNTKKEIEVSLPDIKIIANEIDADSFTYVSSKKSVFNDTDMEDITDLIAGLKTAKAEKVMADEDLLDDAESRAQTVVRDLIIKSDLAAEYKVTFR